MKPPLRLPVPAGARWLVTGGTGFVGRRLVDALDAASVTVLTRGAARTAFGEPVRVVSDLAAIAPDQRFDVVVHLAGEPVAGGPWTPARRTRILRSRPRVAERLVGLVERLEVKPRAWINASAVGWYGMRGDEPLDETAEARDCFSHRVCAAAESAATAAEAYGLRVVQLRIGLVLAREGGLLAQLLVPFRLGLGGRFGAGTHWMSWIERDDLVRLIAHAAGDDTLRGPVNATAPNPVTNADFVRTLGSVVGRPAFLRIPRLPVEAILGDLARELLFGGQRVLPARALESGFEFRYRELREALAYALE
ncbi:MAG: TIGR01777 family protein [Gammaproteobacteria bacterium]|nr:TIGR01777 family protein [Gammaproteobacteria bacterium]